MTYSVLELLELFLIYSFLGWCVEVCFVAVTSGNVVNRGFLNGPVCPIYGVGMLGVLLLLEPIADNLLLLFLGGMVLCTAVELAAGWLLEKIFQTRWWDYTDQPFNLGGYVCLGFSLMWGLAVTFVVRLIHPMLLRLLELIPHIPALVLLAVFYALFVADLILTVVTIVGLRRRIQEMDRLAEALHVVSDTISNRLGKTALTAAARLDESREAGQEKLSEGREKLSETWEAGQERLAEAQERISETWEAGQERLAETRESGQQRRDESRARLEDYVNNTMQELLERRSQLEARQKELLESYRSHPRFGVRRLSNAFPSFRKMLQEKLHLPDGTDAGQSDSSDRPEPQ